MGCPIDCRTTVDKAAVGLVFKMCSDSSGCDQFIGCYAFTVLSKPSTHEWSQLKHQN